MRLSVLGPLTVEGPNGEIHLGSRKQRSILAFLAMHAAETVSPEQILEAVWGDDIPSSGIGTLRFHMSTMRKAIDDEDGDSSSIVTVPGGYSLQPEPGDLDAREFEDLHAEALATEKTDPVAAAEIAKRSLALWTGPEPYSDLRYEDYLQTEVQRLLDKKSKAIEIALRGRLLSGSAEEVVESVPDLLSQSPYDEQLHSLYMEALAATGRRTQALRHYDEYVERLGNETGNLPQAPLQALALELAADEAPTPVLRGSNLPASITPLVGRRSDLERLTGLVKEHRYVDVLGPGGIGKSRLAAEAVRQVALEEDSVGWFIDLTRAQDSVEGAVADALGVKDRPGEALTDVIRRAVGDMPATFLFDNCEALVGDVSSMARDLLQGCPNARVVTTSRFVTDEISAAAFRVGPLGSSSSADDGPILFTTRAAAVGAGLDEAHADTAVEIVSRLDGIPLAIELAASQLGSRSVEDLYKSLVEGGVRALDESLAPAGHGPIWQMLDSSVELLDVPGRELLQRIEAFSGSFTAFDTSVLVGMEERRADVTLQQLTHRSLVVAQPGFTPTRYMLLDTVRQYVADMNSADGIADEVTELHLEWCEELTRNCRRRILDDSQALGFVSERLANIREALDRLDDEEDADRLAKLVSRLDLFWVISGRASEGLRHLEKRLGNGAMSPHVEAVAYSSAALLASIDRRYQQAEDWFSRALDLGEHAPQVVPLVFANRARSRTALAFSGKAADRESMLESAREDFDTAIAFFDATDLAAGLATTLPFAAWRAILVEEPEQAEQYCDKAIAIGEEHGFGWPVAVAQSIRGLLRLAESRPSEAIPDLVQAEVGFEAWGDRYSMQITESLHAAAHLQLDEPDSALKAVTHALSIMETQGSREWEAMTTGIALVVLQRVHGPARVRSWCHHWLETSHRGWRDLLATVRLSADEEESPSSDPEAISASQVARELRMAFEEAQRG